MVASPGSSGMSPYEALRLERLRALAQECRDLAQCLRYRPDREKVLQMARQHDAEADQIEGRVAVEA
jgi:hypothetical protein